MIILKPEWGPTKVNTKQTNSRRVGLYLLFVNRFPPTPAIGDGAPPFANQSRLLHLLQAQVAEKSIRSTSSSPRTNAKLTDGRVSSFEQTVT